MCLTNTVNLIDFDELTPEQAQQLQAQKTKLVARKEAIQRTIDDIERGLEKLAAK